MLLLQWGCGAPSLRRSTGHECACWPAALGAAVRTQHQHGAARHASASGPVPRRRAAGAVAAAAAAASSPQGGGACAQFFAAQGPRAVAALPVINAQLGPSPADPTVPLELQLEVMVPQGGGRCPTVIFTPGFLLNSSLYRSYATRLASWGYAVVLWDLSETLDDTLTCAYMKQALEMCSRDQRLRPHCDASRLLLAGHSRGAKLSCLMAEQVAAVQGLFLVDPVDNSSFGPGGVGYPSSLPALQAAASARRLPVLVVGAALNTDVVPPEANWRRFTAAAAAGGSPVWEVVLNGSSHLQFLDKQQPLFALFSTEGPTPNEVVRDVTQTCIVSFAQLAACPPAQQGAPHSGGAALQSLLAEEGEALRQRAPLSCSFYNMVELGASGAGAPASAAGPSAAAGAPGQPRAAGAGAARGAPKPVRATVAELRAMRVGELKRLLQEHGVASDDCFEKEEIVRRVLERCTLSA